MIIIISGTPGSGKSTIAKLLAKKLGYKHYSAGDFMREMAIERRMSLEELTKIALKERWVDNEIDRRTVELAKKEGDFVIDSRLGWKFIPNAAKIMLTINPDVAAKRIFEMKRPEEKENVTLESTREHTARRLQAEITRYRRLYNIDYTDPKNHDLVIDTSDLTPEQIIDRIMEFLKKERKL